MLYDTGVFYSHRNIADGSYYSVSCLCMFQTGWKSGQIQKFIEIYPDGRPDWSWTDRTIAIVQTGSQYLLLGITSSQVTLLKELNEEDLREFHTPSNQGRELTEYLDFRSVMEKMRKRK